MECITIQPGEYVQYRRFFYECSANLSMLMGHKFNIYSSRPCLDGKELNFPSRIRARGMLKLNVSREFSRTCKDNNLTKALAFMTYTIPEELRNACQILTCEELLDYITFLEETVDKMLRHFALRICREDLNILFPEI